MVRINKFRVLAVTGKGNFFEIARSIKDGRVLASREMRVGVSGAWRETLFAETKLCKEVPVEVVL